jgi:2-succinyl-5-enolpyruvyl-6-hydroxy-3-cyclohexene-1-carboxylate synthase
MNNYELVRQLIFALVEMQVQEVVICAGARNVPIVDYLEKYNLKIKRKTLVYSFFEERSAAFYALGRIKAAGRPVAVVTTSGTAVAETFPAVIESYYQGLPLIVVTADRPKSYRGSGAPQAIDQAGLFGSYCERAVDWDVNETKLKIQFDKHKPFHFNVCFDEPLIDFSERPFKKKYNLQVVKPPKSQLKMESRKLNPLVIVSELAPSERPAIIRFLKENKLYFVSEALSGLKNISEIEALELSSIFYALPKPETVRLCKENFNSIIRIGSVPTIRLWRDLEFELKTMLVYSFSNRSFRGLARRSRLFPMSELSRLKFGSYKKSGLEKLNFEIGQIKKELLGNFKNSEQNYFYSLANLVKSDSLYLGNSLPIREWDEFSRVAQSKQLVYANRGANGIDGQISTYLGWSKDLKSSWCVVGDLTALYDLASLTMASGIGKGTKKRIVIVNNSGGQIFTRLFKNKKYLNAHKLSFKNWALMFGWDFVQIKNSNDLSRINRTKNLIIEILIDNEQSKHFLDSFTKKLKHLPGNLA